MAQEHVVVVDGPAETELVLRAVLQRRGVAISRVRSGSGPGQRPQPSLVVLHGESSDSEWGNVPKLLIGRLSAPDGKPHVVMSVPFEYPELIARIDELLTSA